jgi:hypothetical protein
VGEKRESWSRLQDVYIIAAVAFLGYVGYRGVASYLNMQARKAELQINVQQAEPGGRR